MEALVLAYPADDIPLDVVATAEDECDLIRVGGGPAEVGEDPGGVTEVDDAAAHARHVGPADGRRMVEPRRGSHATIIRDGHHAGGTVRYRYGGDPPNGRGPRVSPEVHRSAGASTPKAPAGAGAFVWCAILGLNQ